MINNNDFKDCLEQINSKKINIKKIFFDVMFENNVKISLKTFVKQAPNNPESIEVKKSLKDIVGKFPIIFELVDKWDDADFIWRGTTKGFDDELYKNISNKELGLINHFTNAFQLTKKDNLVYYLKSNNLKQLAPKSFVWKFGGRKIYCSDNKYKLWIFKPNNINSNVISYGGAGIKLFRTDEFDEFYNSNPKGNWVVQEYIEEPLLFNDRKFDIRIYVLITTKQNEKGFNACVYNNGLVRISSKKYNPKSKDPKVFLTNTCIQRENNPNDNITIEFYDLNINHKKTLKKIRQSCKNLFKNTNLNPNDYKASYQIFGLDFILDNKENPILLEVNSTPSIHYLNFGKIDKKIKKNLLNKTFEIVMKNKIGSIIELSNHKYDFTKIL